MDKPLNTNMLLATHGAQAFRAFSYSLLLLLSSNIFQIFSSNLSNPISRGGIKWSLCGANPKGPHILHRDEMTPPPPPLLDCNVLYYTLLYIGVLRVAINIYIRYGIKWVTFCCSYVFCHKMVTNGQILVFEVSIEPYWALLLDASM